MKNLMKFVLKKKDYKNNLREKISICKIKKICSKNNLNQ